MEEKKLASVEQLETIGKVWVVPRLIARRFISFYNWKEEKVVHAVATTDTSTHGYLHLQTIYRIQINMTFHYSIHHEIIILSTINNTICINLFATCNYNKTNPLNTLIE